MENGLTPATTTKVPAVDPEILRAIDSLAEGEERDPGLSPLERVRQWAAQRDALRRALEIRRSELTALLAENEAAIAELGGGAARGA